jgi:hypothetical protein
MYSFVPHVNLSLYGGGAAAAASFLVMRALFSALVARDIREYNNN